jgi:hypothetical protein|tara:strand:+ start:89 stop:658 length:570 start_codon:yes stop_codon:yes gene_type:complete
MFFRLAPFIIVSYFTLQSLFNQDMKGVIYIIGLIVASFVTVILGGILKKFSPPKGLMPTDYSRIRCTQLTLGSTQPVSVLPLSQTVFGYTFAYLAYFIASNNLQTQNIATFIMFPLVIVADIIWSTSNLCSNPKYLLISLIIGAIIGTLWAMIIESTNMPNLAYMSGIANKDVCSKPSKSLYKCRSIAK